MNLHWLLRAKRWAQNPPSRRQIQLVGLVLGICIALYAVEQIWGWPEWLTPNQTGRGRILR